MFCSLFNLNTVFFFYFSSLCWLHYNFSWKWCLETCLFPSSKRKCFNIFSVGMVYAIGFSVDILYKSTQFYFITNLLKIFLKIMSGYWILSNTFPALIEKIIWLSPLNLLLWWIKLIDFIIFIFFQSLLITHCIYLPCLFHFLKI